MSKGATGAREEARAANGAEEFAALTPVLEALSALGPEQRTRVVRTVAVFLNVPLTKETGSY